MTTRAKEISESYKGSEITFDKTTPGAVAKGFTSTDVQGAIVEAKYVAPALPVATQSVLGIVRSATDYESLWASPVNAYVTPPQMAAKINNFWTTVIQPAIPPRVTLPTVTYGGQGSYASMQATYASLPVGSTVVFEEYYTYEQGWGNGSSWVGAYRRRTMMRTNNAGWQALWT